MSNNLVSQPLMIPNSKMDHVPNKLEAPMPTGMIGGISSSPRVQQVDTSNKQMGMVQPMPNYFGYYNPSMSNSHMGQKDMQMSELVLPQCMMRSQHDGVSMTHMLINQGSPKISLPIKRTAAGEHIHGNYLGQQPMTPNKNIAQVSPFTNKPAIQQQTSKPASNKKMTRNASIFGRTGSKQVQNPKSQTMQMEPSSKNQAESFESVRSKMRESLASALALVTEQQGKASKDYIITSGNSADNSEKKEGSAADKAFEGQITSQPVISNDVIGGSAQGCKSSEPEFQYITSALAGEEVPFADSLFVQDELLQGNGLTWAMDLAVDVGETKEVEIAKKPLLMQEDVSTVGKEEVLPCPQILASKIEAELFKLFGGVNKKYKEKGRSLLFNLKDHNNPELRERVMSGEISPESLCAMSAEELASKELSEWRMAKAEELAQMKVLPDSDVDIRRLVRKTHKGEFQVEVEQDDGVSVEVSVGTSVIARPKRENKGVDPSSRVDKANGKGKVVGEKSGSDNKDIALTIPNDVAEADFMQGLMVDEFKDADFLPPIVSLDEFMESLDTEPPFENLQVEGEKTESPSDNDNTEGQDQVTPIDKASKEVLNASVGVSDKVDTKHVNSDVKMKPRQSPTEEKFSPPGLALMGERLWEGLLQLSLSAGVNAVGLFRSGEKTLTKEWPPLLEIKGRVRLDAFEKFISDLPMSRSRAVMLAHFALKEGSSDADHATFGEAVHSYVLDERLGLAEPVPGSVEIYFCPPHPKILEMLHKHLSKFNTDILNSIDNGLIGVIVWRRPHITSTLSPNSTSHHKHVSKNPRHSTSTASNIISNNNVKHAPHQRVLPPTRPPPHQFNDEDDDDIPPGFGPSHPRARDEDDLPEFNFKQNVSNSRPVDQMRELVLKYGQTGNNNNSNSNNNNDSVGIKRWNTADDDDDILPEWLPGQQPAITNRILQQQQSWVPLQGTNMVQSGRWVNQVPRGIQEQRQDPSANIGSQLYGMQRYPINRGF